MLKYQVIPGLTVNNPALPVIMPRPEDVMANIPGWVALIDPEFVSPDRASVRNRALPRSHVAASAPPFPTLEWSAGVPALGNAGGAGSLIYVTGDIDKDRWSFFAPIKVAATATAHQKLLLNPTAGANTGDIAPCVYLNAASTAIGIGERFPSSGTDPRERLAVSHDFAKGTPALVMATFSIERGLAIYINGALRGQNTTDRRPLNKFFRSGEWGMMGTARYLAGMQGVLGIDLSAPENAAHRRVIEDFIMGKYGIARAV